MLGYLKSALDPRPSSRASADLGYVEKNRPEAAKRETDEIPRSPGSDKDISIKVGQGDNEETIHVHEKVWKSYPYLHLRLEDGSCLPYVDLKTAQVTFDFLHLGILDRINGNEGAVFNRLFEPCTDASINFSKAWHLGHEFELPDFQSKLVGAYRGWYAKLLQERTQIIPSAAAFLWLRDYVSYHTPAEKFLIDFAAGMCHLGKSGPPEAIKDLPEDTIKHIENRYGPSEAIKHLPEGIIKHIENRCGPSEAIKDLPEDIIKHIENRWLLLSENGESADRILKNHKDFRIHSTDMHVECKKVKIIPPPGRFLDCDGGMRWDYECGMGWDYEGGMR